MSDILFPFDRVTLEIDGDATIFELHRVLPWLTLSFEIEGLCVAKLNLVDLFPHFKFKQAGSGNAEPADAAEEEL